jgi:hypothetical protein
MMETRREKIVRFLQWWVGVGVVIGLATVAGRWSQLGTRPGNEIAGTAIGYMISGIPFGMMFTAIGFGIALVIEKFRGKR